MKKYDIIKRCPSFEKRAEKIIKLFGLLLINIVADDKIKVGRLTQSLIADIEKLTFENCIDLSFSHKKQWQLHQLLSALGVFIKELNGGILNGGSFFYEDKVSIISHLSHIVHQIQKGEVK